MNGKILNTHKIARDVGVSDNTISSYYEILEQTFLGFRLPPYHRSIRKTQLLSSKFYFFDTGVKKAIEESLGYRATPGTSSYGDTFEHFFINEVYKLNEYERKEFHLSYFQTSMKGEIDLILSRSYGPTVLIEIKSSEKIDEIEVRKLARYNKDFPSSIALFVSRHKESLEIKGIKCLHWRDALNMIKEL